MRCSSSPPATYLLRAARHDRTGWREGVEWGAVGSCQLSLPPYLCPSASAAPLPTLEHAQESEMPSVAQILHGRNVLPCGERERGWGMGGLRAQPSIWRAPCFASAAAGEATAAEDERMPKKQEGTGRQAGGRSALHGDHDVRQSRLLHAAQAHDEGAAAPRGCDDAEHNTQPWRPRLFLTLTFVLRTLDSR